MPSKTQWVKNAFRTLISPATQVLMSIGIFPAQTLSSAKKTPLLGFLIRAFQKATGYEHRDAKEVFDDLKGKKSDIIHANSLTDCKTDFARTVKLETFQFEHKEFNRKNPEEKYYRIHAPGNSGNCSRFFDELETVSARHPELKTITYNHPGVEGSGGVTMTKDDLVNGMVAQTLHLINDEKVPANQIELSGFSIGAATAALAAEKLKAMGHEVNLFCDRTFSTIPDVMTDNIPIVNTIFRKLKIIPGIKELIHYVVQPAIKYLIFKPLTWLINWDMNPARAYKNIDAKRKTLTVVKPKLKGGSRDLARHTDFFREGNPDTRIRLEASLYAGTTDPAGKQIWKEGIKHLPTASLTPLRSAYAAPHRFTSETLLTALEKTADNAISANAILQMKKAGEQKHPESKGSNLTITDPLLNLAILGDKAKRLKGTEMSNAHDATADEVEWRTPKAFNEEPASGCLTDIRSVNTSSRKSALEAAGLDAKLPTNAVTYYSLFHQAIKSTNRMLAENKANAPASAVTPGFEHKS